MSTHLNGHHRRTLDSIFRHPASHNVEWHDVFSLLNNVGTAHEQHNGKVEITVGTDRIIIARAHGNDLGGEELQQLRSFLGKAGLDPAENHLRNDQLV